MMHLTLGGAGLIEIRNSWLFDCGHLDGDGCGIKTGGSYLGDDVNYINRKIYKNLIAWGSYGISMIEYPDYYRLKARIFNNTFYKNQYGIGISDNGSELTGETFLYNNIIHSPTALDAGGRPHYLFASSITFYMASHNNISYGEYGSLSPWLINDTITVTDADFLLTAESEADSITAYAQLTAARVDGNLPEITFMKLASGSDLIDYGIQTPATDSSGVVLVYNGASPDLGWAEYSESVPAVSTASVSLIKSIQALISGDVISDGDATITARGIVWGTSANPTTSNNVVTVSGTTGAFTTTLTGLTSNTTYYVRSYATNSAGTSYGSNVSFTTEKRSPPILTGKPMTITVNGQRIIVTIE